MTIKTKNIWIINYKSDLKFYNSIFGKSLKESNLKLALLEESELSSPGISIGLKVIKHNIKIEYIVKKLDYENTKAFNAFYNDIKNILDNSIKRVPSLSTKLGYEKIPNHLLDKYQNACGEHLNIIHSLLFYKFCIEISLNSDYDILDFAVDIFMRLAGTQFLPNGNKRNAVLFLISFLKSRCIYLESSNNINKKYLSSWEKIVTIAATGFDQKEVISSDGEVVDFKNKGEKLNEEELHTMIRQYIISIAFIQI